MSYIIVNKKIMNFKFLSYISFACFLFLFACSQPQGNNGQEKSTPANEDDLYGRLSADLFANPAGQAQLDQNALVNYALDKQLDVERLPSGVYMQILNPGEGPHPDMSTKLSAHYRGTLLDGKEFDSSFSRNEPLGFTLAQMIPGWQQSMPKLGQGGKAILLIPSHLAYGARGYPGLIPANAPLRFDVELLKVGE